MSSQDQYEDIHQLLSADQLESIRSDINQNQPEMAIQAITDKQVRKDLARYVRKHYDSYIAGRREVTDYIVKELVGMGFLEDLLADPNITDIGWNGTFLTVETNDAKVSMSAEDLGGVTEDYIKKILSRFATVQSLEINDSHPILDLLKDGLRVSATNQTLSPEGSTMSIRVTRPRLALNDKNFKIFAPMFILDFIHKIMLTKCNIVISGITGTGKTELQKLMLSFTNPTDRIIMIEDVQETHLKELFPDKDIFSWLTTEEHPIKELVKASLRNNPDWIIVSETRGAEAYEMLQAILTGNNIVTTLHAISASAIPKRFANMIAMTYQNTTEDSLMDDILTYFDFGFHIEKIMLHDEKSGESKRMRFLQEIKEYDPKEEGGGHSIFRQEFRNGRFYITVNDVSENFQKRMAMKFLQLNLPTDIQNQARDDIDDTPEGQLLLKLRERYDEGTQDVETKLYNGYDGEGVYEDDDNNDSSNQDNDVSDSGYVDAPAETVQPVEQIFESQDGSLVDQNGNWVDIYGMLSQVPYNRDGVQLEVEPAVEQQEPSDQTFNDPNAGMYVDPNTSTDYSNPNDIAPTQPMDDDSLFDQGLDPREQFKHVGDDKVTPQVNQANKYNGEALGDRVIKKSGSMNPREEAELQHEFKQTNHSHLNMKNDNPVSDGVDKIKNLLKKK